jgi:hypothetical protein
VISYKGPSSVVNLVLSSSAQFFGFWGFDSIGDGEFKLPSTANPITSSQPYFSIGYQSYDKQAKFSVVSYDVI